uniref:Uncharacterized protein n=1 Tax=Anguilla anguilla TaxID=7936 RepID=A0A0E9U1V3_ANGAN
MEETNARRTACRT